MKATRPGQVVGKALERFDTTNKTYGSNGTYYGKILTFVNLSFADPGNFLASLSMDDQGNLIVPKIKTASITLDQSVASASSSLRASETSVAISLSTDPNYSSPGPSLAESNSQYIDLSGKIASLEDRVKNLESRVGQANTSKTNTSGVGSNSPEVSSTEATSSAEIAGISSESSDSAAIASDYTLNPNPSTLDLTPPDLLLASGSAYLSDISITSDADIGGALTSYLKKDRTMPIWQLRFAKHDSLKLLPWIYYRPNLPCLTRKRKIAERFMLNQIG